MSESGNRTLDAATARENFLRTGRGAARGVGSVIASSWDRSLSAGVQADRLEVAYCEELDFESRLMRCAHPVIERLGADMVDVPVVIALCDAQARIVHRYDCSTSVGRVIDRVSFQPGFSYGESGVGTNGVGTVFETGQAVTVVGPEHFNERLHAFACTGAPIIDQVTGRAAGVLDVSCLSEHYTALMQSVVKSAAADISRSLLTDRGPSQVALFEAYLQASSRGRYPVIAIGPQTQMVNDAAQRLFSPDERQAIHEYARFLLARQVRTTGSLELADGRSARIRSVRISADDETSGLALVLGTDEPTGGAHPSARTLSGRARPRAQTLPEPPKDARSAAWVRAWTDVGTALQAQENLLVLGESGTGKRTLLADAAGHQDPRRRVVVLEADEAASWPCVSDLVTAPTLAVIRHVERFDAAGAATAVTLLRALASGPGCSVAATLTGDDLPEGAPVAAVLPYFAGSVTVPPLRLRSEDLPLILTRALCEIAAPRAVRLSGAASQALTSHHWPGNITQLRQALRAAVARRPAGEIQVTDLPGFCRSGARRTLTAIETAERDAILDALHATESNRVHAALALGMSRSTLYRKIRVYGIRDL